MSIFSSIAGLFIIILIAVLLGLLIRSITGDASQRGFSGAQVFWLRVACLIFFPEALILYFIFRPAVRAKS